jgi:hypothetical protein
MRSVSPSQCDQYLQYYFCHRNRFVLLFSLTIDSRAFNAPPARRIIGYQCTIPHCGKVFTNVFAYDQYRNHATRAGTLCASIKMREELTAVGRADRSSAVLSARPRRGNERDACTKRDAHKRKSSADMFTRDPRQKFRRIQHTMRPCSKFVKILLNSSDFWYTGWPSFEGQPVFTNFSSFKHCLGFFRWCSEFKEFRHINMFLDIIRYFKCI